MPARFVPNEAGIRRVLQSEDMQQTLAARMERARIRAEAIAAVDTGRYAYAVNIPPGERGGGFHVVSGVDDGRAFARLVNDTPYAYFLEFGTRYMKAHKTLRRSIDALRSR